MASGLALVTVFAHPVRPEIDFQALARSLADALAGIRTPRNIAAASAFAGLLLGWCSAFLWGQRRSRWKPILLIDVGRPNMSLNTVLQRVRDRLGCEEPEAIERVLAAGRSGSLTIWSRSASGGVRHASNRVVVAVFAERGHPRRPGRALPDLVFVPAEVEERWPALDRALLTGDVLQPGNAS